MEQWKNEKMKKLEKKKTEGKNSFLSVFGGGGGGRGGYGTLFH